MARCPGCPQHRLVHPPEQPLPLSSVALSSSSPASERPAGHPAHRLSLPVFFTSGMFLVSFNPQALPLPLFVIYRWKLWVDSAEAPQSRSKPAGSWLPSFLQVGSEVLALGQTRVWCLGRLQVVLNYLIRDPCWLVSPSVVLASTVGASEFIHSFIL